MYSRNVAALIGVLKADQGIRINLSDDIVGVCCVTHAGRVRLADGRIPAPEPAPSAA
jgi:hypothetical protein